MIALYALKQTFKDILGWAKDRFETVNEDPFEKAYLEAATDNVDLERRQRELLNRYQHKFYV